MRAGDSNSNNGSNSSNSSNGCGAISNDLKSTFGVLNVIRCDEGAAQFVRKTNVRKTVPTFSPTV